MLKKLLKYDIIYMNKCLVVFYILSIFCAICTRIFDNLSDANLVVVIAKIFSGATISMMCSIIFNNILRLWARYASNLYGDESYLTHTLPISKNTHYMSKFLATIITVVISSIVIICSLFIAYIESFEQVKNIIDTFAFTGANVIEVICLLGILLIEIIHIVQVGFTGITLGNRRNNMKAVWSLIYGLIVYLISQGITLIVVFIIAIINSDVKELMFNSYKIGETVSNPENSLRVLIYGIGLLYVVIIAVICLFNKKVLNKGINVD